MGYISLGILGFVGFFLFDLLSMRQRIVSKYVCLLLGIGLIAYSSIRIVSTDAALVIPAAIRYLGLALALLFLMLLIYSVFIEVGSKTYEPRAIPELVTSGTYSLVRHPGVIWLFLAYLFAGLYFANSWLLIAAFVWTLFNLLYIVLQERLVLMKLFADYTTYMASTPMVIPTISSVRRFFGWHNWRNE